MRFITAFAAILTTLAIAFPNLTPAKAQEYEVGERWMTMGKTSEGIPYLSM